MINRKEFSKDAQVGVTRQLDPVVPELHASNARKGPKDSSPGQVMPQFTPKINDKLLLRGVRCLAFLALLFCVGSAQKVRAGQACALAAAEASFAPAVDGVTHNGARRRLGLLELATKGMGWRVRLVVYLVQKDGWRRKLAIWLMKRELKSIAKEHRGNFKKFEEAALKKLKKKSPKQWITLAKSDGKKIMAELKDLDNDGTFKELKDRAVDMLDFDVGDDLKRHVESFAEEFNFSEKEVKGLFKKIDKKNYLHKIEQCHAAVRGLNFESILKKKGVDLKKWGIDLESGFSA